MTLFQICVGTEYTPRAGRDTEQGPVLPQLAPSGTQIDKVIGTCHLVWRARAIGCRQLWTLTGLQTMHEGPACSRNNTSLALADNFFTS